MTARLIELVRRGGLGWLLAVVLGATAYSIQYLPFAPFRIEDEAGVRYPIGAGMVAIILGVLIANLFSLPVRVYEGGRQIVRQVIPVAIVLIGAGLNLAVIAVVGLPALMVVLIGIVIAFAGAWLCGWLLGLRRRTSMLIGAGTAICGNSAIFAIVPIVKPSDEELALSVGVINFFGLLTMLGLPVLAMLIALDAEAFGIWAGASVHAVPQAIAAGFAYGAGSGEVATLVKLVRVALLAPMVFFISLLYAARRRAEGRRMLHACIVPWFIWGFFLLAMLRTFLPGAEVVMAVLSLLGSILLTISMAAIGLEVDLRQLARVGGPALLAGFTSILLLAGGSLLLIILIA